MCRRLTAWHIKRVELEKTPGDIPADFIPLYGEEFEEAWTLWTLLEGIGWKYPPSVLLDQPQHLMESLATITWLSNKIEAKVRGG